MITPPEDEIRIVVKRILEERLLQKLRWVVQKRIEIGRRKLVSCKSFLKVGQILVFKLHLKDSPLSSRHDGEVFRFLAFHKLGSHLAQKLRWELCHASDTCRETHLESGFRARDRNEKQSSFFFVLLGFLKLSSGDAFRKRELIHISRISPDPI